MRNSFLIPIITWLPPGYDCTIVMPNAALAPQVRAAGGRAERYWKVMLGGCVVAEGSDEIEFRAGKVVSGPEDHVVWRGSARKDWPAAGGLMEFGIRALDDAPLFTLRRLPSFYNVYSGLGRKSFLLCHAWKFGSPQVISQIARFGQYVDAYPVIHIDRARDLGDSLVLINPYRKAILARIVTQDRADLPRIRIDPMTVAMVSLADLVAPAAGEWMGQIQLTANNRLVTYIVKHSLADATAISTVEHLDPFRADPTHFPWFRSLRLWVGDAIERRRAA
jgi:hypothetical protein